HAENWLTIVGVATEKPGRVLVEIDDKAIGTEENVLDNGAKVVCVAKVLRRKALSFGHFSGSVQWPALVLLLVGAEPAGIVVAVMKANFAIKARTSAWPSEPVFPRAAHPSLKSVEVHYSLVGQLKVPLLTLE